MANSVEFSVPPSGVCRMAATLPSHQSQLLMTEYAVSMATSQECHVPLTGVCAMAATQPSFQGGKTMSSSSGYAVAAMSGPPESSNAHQVPMIDIGSTTMVPKPTRADLLLELAEARRAFLEAEADLDYTSDSEPESSHSVDVGGGPVSLGQPSPSTARESPSTGVYSPPLPTTTSTPTRYPVDIFDALDSVYVPCVLSAPAETAAGLSRTRPAVQSPITASLSAPAETSATGPSSITVADIHQGQVMQLDEDLRDGYESGRGHSIWRKPWTQGSALPLHATSRQTVAHDGGSNRITDGVSSLVHPHHAHHGQGRSVVAHSVRTPTLSALSEPSEMQPGESGQYPYNLT